MRYPSVSVRFAKYEGLGNDFLIVDAAADLDAAMVQRLCDRHLGVGADGVLFVGASSMRVINADGSTAEMCGNGIRCVALHLARNGGPRELTLDTGAGPHRCRVLDLEDTRAQVEVEMRSAEVGTPDDVFPLEGLELRLTRVSMGNPHAVLFDEIGNAARLGPRLERDERFPGGVNVGFARVASGGRTIELAVWERGVGFTRACGTGACAAAAAAVATGRIPRGEPIEVRLPGGTLRIEVGEPGAPVKMTGPARHVFDGTVDPGERRA